MEGDQFDKLMVKLGTTVQARILFTSFIRDFGGFDYRISSL